MPTFNGVSRISRWRGGATSNAGAFLAKMNVKTKELGLVVGVGRKLYNVRVATAQGKQGIWLLTFPDRENTGNLVNLIFYTGKIVATQGKF